MGHRECVCGTVRVKVRVKVRVVQLYVCLCAVQLSTANQERSLLSKDVEFYSRQTCQLETKLRYADDRVNELTGQLEKTKQAREALFSEYVASR